MSSTSSRRCWAVHRLRVEPLEDRRMLSVAAPQIEFFSAAPALFVENQGQWADASVRFIHQGDDAAVAMTDEEIRFQVSRAEQLDGDDTVAHWLEFSAEFVGAQTVAPVGLARSETVLNYFVGDEANWRAGLSSYEVVAYEGLYDGIDLMTWGRRNSLKYEFHVAPGADASQIAVRYDGIAALSLAGDGSLVVDLGGDWGSLTDDAPYIYQVIDGRQVEIAGQFEILDATTYTFAITGSYDPTVELVIDPNLAWATYLGGSGADRGYGIAVDAAGNALLAGGTDSTDFVGRINSYYGGLSDAFVAKVTPTGSVAWVTYVGGSGWDYGYHIALDDAENALIIGTTDSTDLAAKTNTYYGGDQDAFVAKLTPSGSLVWATYLGGSDFESATGIIVDTAGNALATGWTSSTDLPASTNTSYGGEWDAFVAKLDPSGSIAWTSYLGGSGSDYAEDVDVDRAGNILVTGWTDSTDFVGNTNSYHGGFCDAFVAKLGPTGSPVWSTYFGGSGSDIARGIAINGVGNAMVVGETDSTDFAGVWNSYLGGNTDGFLVKVTPTGSVAWARYLGGNDYESAGDIVVNATGHAFVTGGTRSGDFEACTNDYHGGYDAFVAMITPSGSVVWATLLGGDNFDVGLDVAVDAAGNALVAGATWSDAFEGRNNSYHGGDADAFTLRVTATGMPVLLGDANADGTVDAADAAALALNWKTQGKTWAQGDFNDDGRVDERDASILASHWGMIAEALAPPVAEGAEPSTDEPIVMAMATVIGPRPTAIAPGNRRRLEPVQRAEATAIVAAAHDAVLADAELLDAQLAWSHEMAQSHHRRRLARPDQTLDLVALGD